MTGERCYCGRVSARSSPSSGPANTLGFFSPAVVPQARPPPPPPVVRVRLFHSHGGEAIPEDHLLELADWAYRKLAYLNSREVAAFADPKGVWGG